MRLSCSLSQLSFHFGLIQCHTCLHISYTHVPYQISLLRLSPLFVYDLPLNVHSIIVCTAHPALTIHCDYRQGRWCTWCGVSWVLLQLSFMFFTQPGVSPCTCTPIYARAQQLWHICVDFPCYTLSVGRIYCSSPIHSVNSISGVVTQSKYLRMHA